jgi:hypothetical protein
MSQIENGSAFGIYEVFYSQPERQKQIERKTKTQGDEGEVDKGGPDHPGPDPQSLCDPAGNFESPFLEKVQEAIKDIHALKLVLSIQ